ncbi:putative DNA-binding domain-containing protein [Myxococcota bacterium]|nr:putative DNA-binding domain-containing protein [Myxococcota bacterium]
MPGESLVRFVLDSVPGPSPFPRADLYREFTRKIHLDILEVAFPRFRSVVGLDRLEEMMDSFFESNGPRTLQYPCVPDEFLAWAISSNCPGHDLLNYERAAVRAERHPAELDHCRSPEEGERGRLNPTLEVCVAARAVHQITPENPEPPSSDRPQVYLCWRRPRTDAVARQRVGPFLGRALGFLGLTPLTREAWLHRVLDAQPDPPPGTQEALVDLHRDLVSREGILWCADPD